MCNFCSKVVKLGYCDYLMGRIFWPSIIAIGQKLRIFCLWPNFGPVANFWHQSLVPPEGLMQFLPSFNHAWQLLLAKFFELVKLEFWHPWGPPKPSGGQESNFNSLFPAPIHEGHTLSIWFGYYEWFPRSFVTYIVMNKAKSTSKYLLDVYKTGQTHFFVLFFWGGGRGFTLQKSTSQT